MKNKIVLVVVVVIVVAIVWVLSSGEEKVVSENRAIKIGAPLGLSGPCADFGEGELKAIELAIDEANKEGGINNNPIELIIEDSFCDNKGTASAVQKLISISKVDALIGPTWGDSFQSGFPISQRAGIVAISPSTAMESLEFTKSPINLVYSTWFPQRTEIQFLLDYAKKNNVKEFVVINDNDPFAEMMGDLFKTEAQNAGLTVSYSEKTTGSAEDYRTVITKAKAYPNAALFISFLSPEMKAKFLKQLRELGLKNTVFSSADIENPTLLSSFAKVMEGVIFSSPKISGNNVDFVAKHKAKFGSEPQGPAAGQAYDAASILVEALRKGPVSNLDSNLTKVKVPGATVKEVKFNNKHQVVGGGYILKTIKNGQFVEL